MRFVLPWCSLLAVLAGCQDPLMQQRRELAAHQAAVANEALAKGELQRALFAAELASQYEPLDPNLKDLQLRVSLAQIAATRPSLSLEQFARAAYQARALAERDPSNKHVYETVAAIDAFARGDSAGAEQKVRAVTEASKDYAPAWLLLGELMLASRRPAEARTAFEQAATLQPHNVRAVANLGMAYAQLGDANKAVEALSRSLSMEDTAAVRSTLANAYVALNRPVDALMHFAAAAKLEPRDGRYRVSLGETHLKLDQVEEAAASFRDAATLGAEPWASRGLGAVALKKKDFGAAKQAFSRVLAMAPDELSTLFFAAETEEGLEHPAEAVKLYSRFSELADKVPSENARVLLARDRIARLGPAPK